MKLVVYVAFMVMAIAAAAAAAAVAVTFATGTAAAKNNSIPVGDANAKTRTGKIISPTASIAKKNATSAAAVATTLMKLSAEEENESENTAIKSFSQKLLDSQHDLRDFVSNQANRIYEILKELPKSETDWKEMLEMDVDRCPLIEDVLHVGNFKKKDKLLDVQYTNVEVYGMSDFNNYVLWIDQNRGKAEATLTANELKVVGNYSLSNFLKRAHGSFTLKLSDNVTYTEKDRFCRYANEVDIAAGEATVTYRRSKYEYRKADPASMPLVDVISAKLIQETLYRVGKTLAHRIRHAIISKISRVSAQKNVASTSSGTTAECNRIESIVQSAVSQIRTWLKKTGKIWVPLPKGYHKMKMQRNTIVISNVTLTGLNTMHLRERIRAYKKENHFYIEMDCQAGPLIIGAVVMMTELRNGTLEQMPTSFDYEASRIDAKITLSSSLSDEKDSLQVDDLNLSLSQPNLRTQSAEIDFKPEDLAQLAEFLKPDVESDLHRWLKDFVNDTFGRAK